MGENITVRDVLVWIVMALLIVCGMGVFAYSCGQITACSQNRDTINGTYQLLHPPNPYPNCQDEIVNIAERVYTCDKGAVAMYVPFPPPKGMYVCHCNGTQIAIPLLEEASVPVDTGVDAAKENEQ